MSRLSRACRFPVALLTFYALSILPLVGSTPRVEASNDASLVTDQRARQVLSRLTFGARPGDLERVMRMGVDAFIEQQLDPDSIDDSALQARIDKLPTLRLDAPDLAAQWQELTTKPVARR